jgi:hypothetical protein
MGLLSVRMWGKSWILHEGSSWKYRVLVPSVTIEIIPEQTPNHQKDSVLSRAAGASF